eukprot:superscaffoldBa00009316_g24018
MNLHDTLLHSNEPQVNGGREICPGETPPPPPATVNAALSSPVEGTRTMTPCVSLSMVGVLLLLSPASCQTVTSPVQDLSNRNADFATRLYRAVASRTDDNILLSPLTLSAAMTALSGAAAGPTAEQLLQGLSLTGLDPETIP